jgi:hypothetical protein
MNTYWVGNNRLEIACAGLQILLSGMPCRNQDLPRITPSLHSAGGTGTFLLSGPRPSYAL